MNPSRYCHLPPTETRVLPSTTRVRQCISLIEIKKKKGKSTPTGEYFNRARQNGFIWSVTLARRWPVVWRAQVRIRDERRRTTQILLTKQRKRARV